MDCLKCLIFLSSEKKKSLRETHGNIMMDVGETLPRAEETCIIFIKAIVLKKKKERLSTLPDFELLDM